MSFKNTLLPVQTTIQSHGRLLDLSTPVVMGILNATPDSFFDKGKGSSTTELLTRAEKMLQDSATILDIGGATTKPGAAIIDAETEIARVLPAVKGIVAHFPDAWISIDTYNSKTAKACVAEGAHIINDVSSGALDKNMLATVAALKVPYIAMHMQGNPQTMQQAPAYEDVTTEVRTYLHSSCKQAEAAGITDIIIDPGYGFGKTVSHNFTLLKELHTFRMLGKPILAGLSRKSMICRTLNITPEYALNGTTALNMVALQQGANILRVHDVKEAVETITLFQQL